MSLRIRTGMISPQGYGSALRGAKGKQRITFRIVSQRVVSAPVVVHAGTSLEGARRRVPRNPLECAHQMKEPLEHEKLARPKLTSVR